VAAITGVAGIRQKLSTSTKANRILKILFTLSHLLSFKISLSPLDLEHSANQLNDALIPAVQ